LVKSKKVECSWCCEKVPKNKLSVVVEVGSEAKINVCKPCLEDAEYCPECGAVQHSDWKHQDFVWMEEIEEFLCIQCYAKRFGARRVWHSTDRWRGHFTFEPINEKTHAVAVECCLVPHDQNDEIIKLVKNWLELHRFDYHVFGGATSNVFSACLTIIAWRKNGEPLRKKDKKMLKQLDETFVDYYTRGFSVFTGETYPIDLEAFAAAISKI